MRLWAIVLGGESEENEVWKQKTSAVGELNTGPMLLPT